MKYLFIRKLQLFNISHNLLTNFHIEKFSPFYLSISWHGVRLKFTLMIRLDIWRWLVTSATWSRDFVWKRFWSVTKHATKVTISFIVSFCRGLSLVQVSTSYYMPKLRFQRGGYIPFSPLNKTYMQKEIYVRMIRTSSRDLSALAHQQNTGWVSLNWSPSNS